MTIDNSTAAGPRAWWRDPMDWWIGGALGYLVVYASWLAFRWTDPAYETLIANVVYLPPGFFALISAVAAVASPSMAPQVRRAWLWIALGILMLIIGDVVYLYLEATLQDAMPFPSVADVFYLLFYPLAMIGMLGMPTEPLRRGEWRIVLLDFAIIVLGSAAVLWYFVIAPSMAGGDEIAAQVVAGAYPVMDLLLLAAVGFILIRRPSAEIVVAVALLGIGLQSYLVADVLYLWLELNGLYQSGAWLDLAWALAYVLMGVAALRRRQPRVEAGAARWQLALKRLSDMLPIGVTGLGVGVALYAAVSGDGQGPRANGVFVGVAAMIMVVMARFLITQRANARLVKDLQQATQRLEADEQALQARVAERVRDLSLAAEVGQTLAKARALDDLLRDSVTLIRDRFDLYHTQVYLLDPRAQVLRLEASTGEAGAALLARRHRLPVGADSLNGQAVLGRAAVLVTDTRLSPNFKPNPLLPQTRSEAVVPLLAGEEVLGVLDFQSAQPGAFTADNLPVFQTLAGQLAIGIENARLLSQAEAARAELEAQSRRLTRAGWQDLLDGLRRPERLEGRYEREAPADAAEPADAAPTALQAPIQIGGETVGRLELAWAGARPQTETDAELMEMVAAQVGQQIDNLRLLAQAEQYRAEAERALQRLTHEGWQTYLASDPAGLAGGYVYDGDEVKPAAQAAALQPGVTRPLALGGVNIGEIAVEAADLSTEEAQILSAVAEQLAARVDTLRLNSQIESTLGETEQLYAISAELNASGSLEDLVRVARLAAPSGATTFLFTHLTDPLGQPDRLRIAAALDARGEALTALTGREFQVTAFSFAKFWIADPGNAFLVEDTATDPRLDDAARATLAEARALAILPLMVGGRWVGQISYTWEAPRAFPEGERRLYHTLMRQAATAMDNHLLFDHTRRRAERERLINEITLKIQSTATVPGALQTAVQELGLALKARQTRVSLSAGGAEPPPMAVANGGDHGAYEP